MTAVDRFFIAEDPSSSTDDGCSTAARLTDALDPFDVEDELELDRRRKRKLCT